MGYANANPFTILELSSNNADEQTVITTTPTTLNFNQNIELPSWIVERLRSAFLIMAIGKQKDTSGGGQNWTNNDQYIQIDVTGTGTSYTNAIFIASASFGAPSGATEFKYIVTRGAIDLGGLAWVAGTGATIQWLDARALRNNLELSGIKYSLYCILD